MKDIRQSEMYAEYMKRIGWIVEGVGGAKILIKKFPIIGSFIKIQRPEKTPSLDLINALARKYRAWRISLEFSAPVHPGGGVAPAAHLGGVLGNGFKVNKNPYLPTKTIQINLTESEDKIFQRFTEAKRRAVRKAMKNNIVVKEGDIEDFIKLKSKNFWPLGYFMKKDVTALWESFRPNNATVLYAYLNTVPYLSSPVAGVLVLFHSNMAYYWMAASSNEGKKLFAPTLLVWEALKLAKKKGCKIFDFEGIYDERFHNATKKWQGFTKFKEGFGGKEIPFPAPLIRQYRRAF